MLADSEVDAMSLECSRVANGRSGLGMSSCEEIQPSITAKSCSMCLQANLL